MKVFLKKILAVVVLYNEELEKTSTFRSLCEAIPNGSVLDIFVYDNSPNRKASDKIEHNKISIQYVHDPTNPGVSAAYNYGASFANQKHKEWLLILDQDSIINPDYFDVLFKSIRTDINYYMPILKYKDQIYSPCIVRYSKGFPLKEVTKGRIKTENLNFLNSGAFIRLSSFLSISGYNETIPLYFSDFDFFKRLKKKESYYYQLEVEFKHSLSFVEDSNLDNFILKFRLYSKGLREYLAVNREDMFLGVIFGLLRCAKQSFKHKTFVFFRVFYQELLP